MATLSIWAVYPYSLSYQEDTLTSCFPSLSTIIVERPSKTEPYFLPTTSDETTGSSVVAGKCFKAGSKVIGEVVEVSRPGVKNPGYVKVKFNTIKDGSTKAEFPTSVTSASVDKAKTTNFVARLIATPISAVARVGGTAARSVSTEAMNISNDGERYLENWSNAFANLFSLQPVASLRNVGKSFVTVGYFIADTAKLAVSGTFGVLYELGDEVRYIILPSSTNDSALNPGDELTIIYNK